MLADGLHTEHKTSVSDVVSAADHAAEALVVERLAAARPEDGVVGEEGTERPGTRTWFVDPVDGTYNFLCGLPIWCAAIALADETGPLAGAVYQPTTDELWAGGPGHPTTRNGVPLLPLADAPLHRCRSRPTCIRRRCPTPVRGSHCCESCRARRRCGCSAPGSIELAAVAAGRLGVWAQIDSLPWDWLPGSCLVLAAGGACEVVQAHGHRWHVAGPPTAVAQTLALINQP